MLVHPGIDDPGLQEREHDVAAAEHERSGAVERVEQFDAADPGGRGKDGRANQDDHKRDQAGDAGRPGDREACRVLTLVWSSEAGRQKISPAIAPITIAVICPTDPTRMIVASRAITAMLARVRSGVRVRVMPQTGLRDDGDGDDLQPGEETTADGALEQGCSIGECDHEDRGRGA